MKHRAGRFVALVIAVLAVSVGAGCSLDDAGIPGLTSPSGLSTAVTLTAIPDSLPRDGSSQSVITVTVRDASNAPMGGQRLSVKVDIGVVTESEIVTDGDGHATFAFVAPASSTVGNSALIQVVPISSGGDAASPRFVTIVLTGPSNSTVPSPSFTVTPEEPEKNIAVIFDASATEDEGAACLDACTYDWDFGDGSAGTGRIISHTFGSPRTYTVVLTVTDAAGTMASVAQEVTVKDVPAPTVTLAVVPNPPIAEQTATFTAMATPATGHGIKTYAWDFGDGDTSSTGGGSALHTYSVVGSYVVTVTVTDDLGQTGSASLSFTIVSSGVTASFTSSPTNPTTATTVQFNGVASTASAGGTITAWAWNFGDGNTATGVTASRQFGAAGTYVVRLTVTDSAGRTGTTTTNIVVTAP